MGPKSKKTILVIEDNRQNREVVSRMLVHGGYDPICAADAKSGLDMARRQCPELILMDIQLPDMDGLEATGLLRRNPATADIKVMALTAYAMRGDRERMIAGGCDDYLAKPIRYQELLQKIEDLIG